MFGRVPLDVRINCEDNQVISPQRMLAFNGLQEILMKLMGHLTR